MTSSYGNERGANVHDVCTSNNGDNDSSSACNIEFSKINGLDNCEDVPTKYYCRNLNILSSSNYSINSQSTDFVGYILLSTDQQDIPNWVTDSLSNNNNMETPPVILTPLSVNTPDYLGNSHSFLNNFRVSNINRVIFAHSNSKSIRNICGMLADTDGAGLKFYSCKNEWNLPVLSTSNTWVHYPI